MAGERPKEIKVRLRWDGVEDEPIVLVNQVIGQFGQYGEVILTFGQTAPPILLGDRDEQREQAKDIQSVPVKPVARLALTRAGLDDVIRILNETRDNYDAALEASQIPQIPPGESSEL